MPEEIENLEDDNNVNEQGNSSSKSSPSSVTGKAASNIIDFNKYKARKNANKDNNTPNSTKNNSGNNLKSSLLNKVKGAGNGLKNKAGNAVLNKVSNAHPALKALSVLNNLNNARKNRKAAKANANSEASDNKISENSTNSSTDTNTSDNSNTTEKSSFNPLSSIIGSKSGILGGLRIFGKLPMPIKLALVFGIPLLCLIIILLPVILIFGVFSPLLGTSEAFGNQNIGGGSGNINYGDYVLSSDGHEILHQPLDEFLSSKGTSLEAFNNLIASNVEENGYGTRAGVVTAAVTLIAELGNNYNVKVPYFWGGGHGIMATGAEGNWGSTQCHTYANGQSYNYCGLDCSGFVTWAIYNGGFSITPLVTGGFQSLPGAERVSLTNSAVLQPGDLLESSGHVILIVGVDENNYICAEAAGNETGVLFSTHPFNASGYWGVNMEGFYNTRARS